jgi:ubiquitin-like 1-activating enzyme E1 B
MDHSEDSENGMRASWQFEAFTKRRADIFTAKEIEKLRQEAQALKQIRESMGTISFPQLLFDKVFKDDVVRLRSMEEMWKTRRPPEPLEFKSPAHPASREAIEKTLKDGQRLWDIDENILVFRDRYAPWSST